MSLVFGRNNDNSSSIRRAGFLHGMQCISVYGSPEEKSEEWRRLSPTAEIEDDDLGSCSSSSIGRNSDDSGDDDSPEDEVQSRPKGPLYTVDALEEVLPMRKGISLFYTGKSKSFTSLADAAAASSVKDFAKPEDPYNKKRKNFLVRSSSLDKKPNNPLRNYVTEISKIVANTNRNKMALGSATCSSDINSTASSPSNCLPPLHPPCKKSTTIRPMSSSTNRPNPPCRSFSLSDLQFAAAGTPNVAGLAVHSGNNKGNELH